mmetsp:Transcript_62953/g.175373  ORF Transcript_62953/g.175373 Transcript_62953/m.175373 type:complete len:279 (+) Transcript_62953:1323-2159(+)
MSDANKSRSFLASFRTALSLVVTSQLFSAKQGRQPSKQCVPPPWADILKRRCTQSCTCSSSITTWPTMPLGASRRRACTSPSPDASAAVLFWSSVRVASKASAAPQRAAARVVRSWPRSGSKLSGCPSASCSAAARSSRAPMAATSSPWVLALAASCKTQKRRCIRGSSTSSFSSLLFAAIASATAEQASWHDAKDSSFLHCTPWLLPLYTHWSKRASSKLSGRRLSDATAIETLSKRRRTLPITLVWSLSRIFNSIGRSISVAARRSSSKTTCRKPL